MKRLNPKTGQPFRRGEIREDGKVFYGYNSKQKTTSEFFYEKWATPDSFNQLLKYWSNYDDKRKSTKSGHIKRLYQNIKSRAKKEKIPFDLTLEYLESIAPDICPVFNIPLGWGESNKIAKKNSPSLDKIDPKIGYVKNNVCWLSQLANKMKQDATIDQLKQFANWINSEF